MSDKVTERLYATTDAQIWAEEFMNLFGHRKEDIDLALMIGWFANAMVTAEVHAFKEAEELAKAVIREAL